MEVDDGVGGADDGCLCVLCAGGASGGASGCREVRVESGAHRDRVHGRGGVWIPTCMLVCR